MVTFFSMVVGLMFVKTTEDAHKKRAPMSGMRGYPCGEFPWTPNKYAWHMPNMAVTLRDPT